MPRMHQAQDNFAAEIKGVAYSVRKGEVYAATHPLVKLDQGRALLFKPLDSGEDDKPKRGAADDGGES